MKQKPLKEKVTIIGAGSWGTTLAIILAKKGVDVTLHSVFEEHSLQMKKDRQNKLFLKGAKFPSKLKIEPSLEKALSSHIIIVAIPVKFLRAVCKKIKKAGKGLKKKVFVSVAKGMEASSSKRPSQIIQKELGGAITAVLSGPNIAKEVLAEVPSTAIIACKSRPVGKKLQLLFTSPTFRIYLHQDVVGVELGGAIKNIIAIACGISDGLGFGANTKASLVTRGLAEIARLGKKLGAKPETFWGISGLGDLVTTCFSPYSRNRSVGEKLGKGKKLKAIISQMKMVAEGVETVKSAYKMSKKFKIEMPITTAVYGVLHKDKPVKSTVAQLMKRPLKTEKVG